MWNLKEFEVVYSHYKSSGLRVKDFCHNECISLSRFFYWQKKLKSYGRELPSPSGFVPLMLNSSGSPAKSPSDYSDVPYHQSKTESVCEVVYPNGIKLRLPLDTDIRQLEQLILLFR